MKKFIFAFLVVSLSATAFASSQVCSGERLYVSHVRMDSGVQPLPGTITGTHVILFDREVLLSYESIEGLSLYGIPPYGVSLEGEQTILEEKHSLASHSKIYSVMAVLNKVDSLTGQVIEEVGREKVVCSEIQNFVP